MKFGSFFFPVDNGELLRNSKQGNNTIILEKALGWRSPGRRLLTMLNKLEIMRVQIISPKNVFFLFSNNHLIYNSVPFNDSS